MGFKIEIPPTPSGASEQQLRQVYGYLYRLAENLNVALNALESQGGNAESEKLAGGTATKNGAADTYNELHALIVNTASVVRKEMDVLETELHSNYEAMSEDWGTFRENIDTQITATARDVVTEYGYDAAIETLQAEAVGFNAYRVKTEGYIRQGFIDYDGNGVPILGIAIGQNLRSTTVTVDGEDYEQFDGIQSCAFYTAEKVSFRIHGQEVAYVSNRKLYIGDVEITGSVVLDGKWQLSTAKGFAIKWIGGDG